MAKKATYEELEQRVKELEKEVVERKWAEEKVLLHTEIVENMAEGAYLIRTSDGVIVYANKTFERMFGYDPGELVNKHVSIVNAPSEKSPEEIANDIIQSLKEKGTWSGEVRNIKKDGTPFWCHANVSTFDHHDFGEVWVSVHQDIGKRKKVEEELKKHRDHLEELVEERTRKLEEVNTELESFAYSVSHDLRAPLRAMQGFSQALLEDYAPKLDAEGKEYALRIDASAQRMETLIQDLLGYSRLSRSEIKLKPVNLDSAVEGILTQLDVEIREKDAHISVEKPLPEVLSHSTTLEQVMGNLITNAIRFVPSEVKPNINISAEERDEVVRLWVEDNGIGIAPEHHERIFRIFERLHGIESYPGTGVGLAIVKKGAEKLGGKVGIESAPGKGSRFWIELTKKGKK